MVATIENYTALIRQHGIPAKLREVHNDFIKQAQKNDWAAYRASDEVRDTVDMYFEKFSEAIEPKSRAKPGGGKPAQTASAIEHVPDLHLETRFVQRFLRLAGKKIKVADAEKLLRSLQTAIVKKQVSAAGKHTAELQAIQETLVTVCNDNAPGKTVVIEVPADTLAHLGRIAKGEVVFTAVNLLKRYVSLQGKPAKRKVLESLFKNCQKALSDPQLISGSDPLRKKVEEIQNHLSAILKSGKPSLTVTLTKQNLRGLGAVSPEAAPEQPSGSGAGSGVMTSEQLMKLSYTTIGLTGKWKALLGDPAKGFSMLVYGKPGQGKSTFDLMLARHLAESGAKVLYVSAEEHGSYTLQEKLSRIGGAVPGMDFIDRVSKADVSKYGFLFIDSVQVEGFTLDDFRAMKAANPSLSIILIMQATKADKATYKGDQEWEHEVDIALKVDGGVAETQKNRYKEPAKMVVFAPKS